MKIKNISSVSTQLYIQGVYYSFSPYEIKEFPDSPAGFVKEMETIVNDSSVFEFSNVDNSVEAAIASAVAGVSATTFNYELSASVTEADIGKMMMQVWEGEGDLDRAAVYQENPGALSDFFFIFNYAANAGNYIEFYIQDSTGYHSAQIVEGTDFTRNADLDIQFASILAGVLANTALSALYNVIAYPTGGARAIRFTAKTTGWGWGNGNLTVDAGNIQDGQPGGSVNIALGKLIEVTGDGWGVIAPYTGQSFISVGPIAKNAQILATNDGKVKARGASSWYQDCVVGLAKNAVNDGDEITLNYCPRIPEIWNDYFSNRLPSSPQEALDMFAFYYWD